MTWLVVATPVGHRSRLTTVTRAVALADRHALVQIEHPSLAARRIAGGVGMRLLMWSTLPDGDDIDAARRLHSSHRPEGDES